MERIQNDEFVRVIVNIFTKEIKRRRVEYRSPKELLAANMSAEPQIDNSKYANEFNDDTNYRNYAVLKLCVNPNNTELAQLYTEHIEKHNSQIRNAAFPNAGFDLFVPHATEFLTPMESKFINLEVKAEMIFVDLTMKSVSDIFAPNGRGVDVGGVGGVCYSTGYYMYPRSSMSKTPLMLANHTGIIDSGYRGDLIAAVRYLATDSNSTYRLDAQTRLFQICHPQLCPVFVVMVSENELSTTARGSGGFGSTGTKGAIR